jgi:hypothetical protein
VPVPVYMLALTTPSLSSPLCFSLGMRAFGVWLTRHAVHEERKGGGRYLQRTLRPEPSGRSFWPLPQRNRYLSMYSMYRVNNLFLIYLLLWSFFAAVYVCVRTCVFRLIGKRDAALFPSLLVCSRARL